MWRTWNPIGGWKGCVTHKSEEVCLCAEYVQCHRHRYKSLCVFGLLAVASIGNIDPDDLNFQ